MTLKDYLEQNDITQAEFAKTLEVDFTTVAKWISGGGKRPKPENMVKIQLHTGGAVTIQDMWPEGFMTALL
jgi:transcriptional regulator with XRE-family HTH domain